MKEPSIIFKSAAEGADQIGGAAPKPPVWGEQQTNLNAIVFSKSHPIHHSYSDFFLLNLTHTTAPISSENHFARLTPVLRLARQLKNPR